MNNQHHIVRSWRRWLFIAFPPLAAVLFALMLTMPALADTVVNVTVPISFTTLNPCNGEVVPASGNVHEVSLLTFDGNGGVHVDFRDNFEDVTGTGSFGNTYHIPVAFTNESNVRVGVEQTITENFNVISQGSAPNIILHADFHITINPDGTVTSFHDNFRAECQG